MVKADRYKHCIRWHSVDASGTVLQTSIEEARQFIQDVKDGKFDSILDDNAYVEPFK